LLRAVREVRCSLCDRVAATFTATGGGIVYVGVLGKHLRTERGLAVDEPSAIERFMKEAGWVEVKSDGVTPAYTIGDAPVFSFDAYCPTCDRVYCKDHMTTRAFAHAGYGEWIVATCPRGHERKVYEDPR
jgi:hypothetical protein